LRGLGSLQEHMLSSLGIQFFPVFLLSSLMLSLLPGPATMYIVGRSAAQGRRAGMMSVLGICAGTLCHILAVAFGVSAIFAASHVAFMVVKSIGAVYLIYVGITLLRSREQLIAAEGLSVADAPPDRMVFVQGSLTQLLNPKVTLFFLAILPQFVVPSFAHKPMPFLFLGAAFVAIDVAWFSLLACGAAAAAGWLVRSSRATANLKRATGGLYVLLGLALLHERTQSIR